MSRYRGPRLRIVRRLQQQLPGLTRKVEDVRTNPPGQHGAARRGRVSDYRLRLEEKQKLRFNYGLSERQMRNYFRSANSKKGDTGKNLLQLLESRLDNVVFRMGLAPTIPAARQMVSHGHIEVDAKRVNIPSYAVSVGSAITLREKSKRHPVAVETREDPALSLPDYLEFDEQNLLGTVKRLPEREDIPLDVEENFVVEYYSRIA